MVNGVQFQQHGQRQCLDLSTTDSSAQSSHTPAAPVKLGLAPSAGAGDSRGPCAFTSTHSTMHMKPKVCAHPRLWSTGKQITMNNSSQTFGSPVLELAEVSLMVCHFQ